MRFLYRYQGKGGDFREGEIAASGKAEAYSVLRKQGIRPMNVWPAPGLANRLASLGKRGWTIIMLCFLCLSLGVLLLSGPRSSVQDLQPQAFNKLPPLPRQQCPVVDIAFKYEAERVLSMFARPGDVSFLPAQPESSNVSTDILIVLPDLDAALADPIDADPTDTPDVVTMKRIVAGLKEEARTLLASGEEGQVAVLQFFIARQRMEASYRRQMLDNVRKGALALSEANQTLRAMGLAEIGENECHPNG